MLSLHVHANGGPFRRSNLRFKVGVFSEERLLDIPPFIDIFFDDSSFFLFFRFSLF